MGRRNKAKKRKAPSTTSLVLEKSSGVVKTSPKSSRTVGKYASLTDDTKNDFGGHRIPPPSPNLKRRRLHRLPPPFPTHLPCPEHGFLRDVAPYREAFQAALQTSYQGFAVDETLLPPREGEEEGQSKHPLLQESSVQEALRSIQRYFVTDVTQPFGLGTACTPTYVTRCLLGESGTTYKYLGLRMFAHDWKRTAAVEQLKDVLSERVTQHHLPALHRQRNASNGDMSHHATVCDDNKPCFDICLINRMTRRPNLKTEPLDDRYKIAVSWHADSSLDHYSTIAVYQTIFPEVEESMNEETADAKRKAKQIKTGAKVMSSSQDTQQEWSIGLRVMHFAEGPKPPAGVAAENEDDKVASSAPPIAVSLPSNSAYYLLDDFNHHHQHTVLVAPTNRHCKSVRYSLTYRLLRESHNVSDMLDRCQRCIAQFHKKGSKVYRYEQLTLTELESEWLRQFYIQGAHHHSILWDEWENYILRLWNHWSQLESRTFQTIQLLQHAAEGACLDASLPSRTSDDSGSEKALRTISKSERRLREKQRRAYMAMKDLTQRENPSQNSNSGLIYESMSLLLEERATMRDLWAQRECEPAFLKMDSQYRPLPLPVQFNVTASSSKDGCSLPKTLLSSNSATAHGRSPLPGTPIELRQLAVAISSWGAAFHSQHRVDLPTDVRAPFSLLERKPCEVDSHVLQRATSVSTIESAVADTTLQSLDWLGWSEYPFGLEMQHPWSLALLEGRKSIETRAYPLPNALINKKIWIIETPKGKDGVTCIVGNHFRFASNKKTKSTATNERSSLETSESRSVVGPRLAGWCIFSSVKQYSSRQVFEMDAKCHLVPSNSTYGWNDDETKVIYGWIVGEYGSLDSHGDRPFSSGIRRFRSLFQLTPDGREGHDLTDHASVDVHIPTVGKKKKQRLSQGSSKRANDSLDGPIRKKRRF